MMLDLRYAAGLPVNMGAIIGICAGLYQVTRASDQRAPGFLTVMFQTGGYMFFGAFAALLFFIPNVTAAGVSNRLASSLPWPAYALCFALICAGLFRLQALLFDRWLRPMGGMNMNVREPRTLALIAANIAMCIGYAAMASARMTK